MILNYLKLLFGFLLFMNIIVVAKAENLKADFQHYFGLNVTNSSYSESHRLKNGNFINLTIGSNINEHLTFESAFFYHSIYEDITKRTELEIATFGNPPSQEVLKIVGLRSRMMYYPFFDNSSKVRINVNSFGMYPYLSLGFLFIPTYKITDPKYPNVYGNSYQVAGTHSSAGIHFKISNSGFFMRLEGGLEIIDDPININASGYLTHTYFEVAFYYSFSFNTTTNYQPNIEVNPIIVDNAEATKIHFISNDENKTYSQANIVKQVKSKIIFNEGETVLNRTEQTKLIQLNEKLNLDPYLKNQIIIQAHYNEDVKKSTIIERIKEIKKFTKNKSYYFVYNIKKVANDYTKINTIRIFVNQIRDKNNSIKLKSNVRIKKGKEIKNKSTNILEEETNKVKFQKIGIPNYTE